MKQHKSDDLAAFAERLNTGLALREKKAADLCRALDLNKGTVSGYTSGAHKPNTKVVGLIAKYLRVNPAWLLGFDVPITESAVLSDEEMEIVSLYRCADNVSKEAIKRILAYHEK